MSSFVRLRRKRRTVPAFLTMRGDYTSFRSRPGCFAVSDCLRSCRKLLQSCSAYLVDTRRMKARTILGRLLLGTALSLALLVLGLMLAAVLGISINAAPWRAAIAVKATALLGRSVTLEGPLRLTIGLRPELTVGGIVVANPPGFSSPQFATLGRAHMLVELWPLLRNEIRVLEMNAEDVHVRLEEAADGRVNWSFSLLSAGNGTQTHRRTEQRVRMEEIDRFALKRIEVELIRDGTTRSFALDELDGQARAGKPIAVTLHGRVEKS